MVALVDRERCRAVQRLDPSGSFVPARVEQRLQPPATLGEVTADAPEAGHRGGQAQRLAGLVRGVPVDGGADVLVLGLEPVEPFLLAGTLQPPPRRFGQGQERGGMALLDPCPLRQLGQPLGGVLADQEQHPEPRAARTRNLLDWSQQALVDQLLKSVQDLDAQVDRRRADGLGVFDADAAAEHRAGGQQPPGAGTEQAVAPGDRGAQGLLTFRQVAGAPDEHGQRMLQPREQRSGRQELDPRRRQLHSEGQAIESPGDSRDRRRVPLVEDETRPGGTGTLSEQPHRLTAGNRGSSRALRVRHLHGRNFELLLACEVKRRAAGHSEPQPHRRLQDLGDEGSGSDQVLEVVEQDQGPRVLQVAAQAIQQRPVTRVPQPDPLRDR